MIAPALCAALVARWRQPRDRAGRCVPHVAGTLPDDAAPGLVVGAAAPGMLGAPLAPCALCGRRARAASADGRCGHCRAALARPARRVAR